MLKAKTYFSFMIVNSFLMLLFFSSLAGDSVAKVANKATKGYFVREALGRVSRLSTDGSAWVAIRSGSYIPYNALVVVGEESALNYINNDRSSTVRELFFTTPTVFRANRDAIRQVEVRSEEIRTDGLSKYMGPKTESLGKLTTEIALTERFSKAWRKTIAIIRDSSGGAEPSSEGDLKSLIDGQVGAGGKFVAQNSIAVQDVLLYPYENEVIEADSMPTATTIKLSRDLKANSRSHIELRDEADNLVMKDSFTSGWFFLEFPKYGNYKIQVQEYEVSTGKILNTTNRAVTVVPISDGEVSVEDIGTDGIKRYRKIKAIPKHGFRWVNPKFPVSFYFDWTESRDDRVGVYYRLRIYDESGKVVSNEIAKSLHRKIGFSKPGRYLWQLSAEDDKRIVLWKSKPRLLVLAKDGSDLNEASIGSYYFERGLIAK